MTYKQQIKQHELLTKLRMIKLVKRGHTQKAVAAKFQCHRNTVSNIIRSFEEKIQQEQQEKLLNYSLTRTEIKEALSPIENQSRAPHSHSRSATPSQEKAVKNIFEQKQIRVGPYRMKRILNRKYGKRALQEVSPTNKSLANLTIGQLKGIYQRLDLKPDKKRSKSGKRVPLYDYRSLACFERLHYDTKEITDQGTLPPEVYDKFKLKKDNAFLTRRDTLCRNVQLKRSI